MNSRTLLAKRAVQRFTSQLKDHYIDLKLESAAHGLVASSQIFDGNSRIIVLGRAGAGKSTLTKTRALNASKALLQDKRGILPIYIPAKLLTVSWPPTGDVVHAIRTTIHQVYGVELHADEFEALIRSNRTELLVDGLDEIASHRDSVLGALSDFARKFSEVRIALTSRPAALSVNFIGFSTYSIPDLDQSEISTLVRRLSGDRPELSADFLAAVLGHSNISYFARNPLMLSLLWEIFQVRSRLPDNVAVLYADHVDFLLRREDLKTTLPRSPLTIDDRLRMLGAAAAYMHSRHQSHLNRAEIVAVLRTVTTDRNLDLPTMLPWDISFRLFVESEEGFSFVHKSFEEYFVAWHYRHEPAKLIDLLGEDDAEEILIFAAGLADDLSPLIEAAVVRGHILLAAKLISAARTNNPTLARYVATELGRVVGGRFLESFVTVARDTVAKTPPADAAARQPAPNTHPANDVDKELEIYAKLLTLLDGISDTDLLSHEKGRRFEEFAKLLFEQAFAIVRHDYRTENGELDLILENRQESNFWAEFGGDILVECKNLNAAVPLKEVNTFFAKVSSFRVKLGFMASVGGFTEDAERAFRNRVSNQREALVIPLTGGEIRAALQRGEDFEEFFKTAIRKIKYLEH